MTHGPIRPLVGGKSNGCVFILRDIFSWIHRGKTIDRKCMICMGDSSLQGSISHGKINPLILNRVIRVGIPDIYSLLRGNGDNIRITEGLILKWRNGELLNIWALLSG